MSKKFSLDKIPAPDVEVVIQEQPLPTGDHDIKVSSSGFHELKDVIKGSKSELVQVQIRMTKAERRKLRAASTQSEIAIQDIVREGVQLWYEKRGMRL